MESRYGITMGRPRLPEGKQRVRLNVRVDGELRRRLDAFQVQEGFPTLTEALERVLRVGFDMVEPGPDEAVRR